MTRSRMRPTGIVSAFAITALLSLMLATTVVAKSPAVIHHVSAGGPDGCSGLGDKPGCDGNYSLVATQYADGSASGQYTIARSRFKCMKNKATNAAFVTAMLSATMTVGVCGSDKYDTPTVMSVNSSSAPNTAMYILTSAATCSAAVS